MSLNQNICPSLHCWYHCFTHIHKKKNSIGFMKNTTVKISINKIGNKQASFVQLHILRNSHYKNITTHWETDVWHVYIFYDVFLKNLKKDLSINGTEPSPLQYVFRHLFYEPHSITCLCCCYSFHIKLCRMIDKMHILKPMLMNGIDFTEMSSFYYSWKWNKKNTIHWRKQDLMT